MARRGTGDNAAAAAASEAASEAGRILAAQKESLKDYAPSSRQADLLPEPKAEAKPEKKAEPVDSQEENRPKPRQTREEKKDSDEPKTETLRRNEPRRRALAEIENRDLKDKGITPEAPEPAKEPEKTATVAAPQQAEVVAAAPAEQVAAAPEAPVMVEVKVDGQTFTAPQQEIDDAGGIKSYQIMKAQENRLQKANEALAQTRQMQAFLAQQVQNQAPKAPTLSDDQFIASKVDLIRFGTPEESAAALREVMDRGHPRIDPNQITQQAVSQMMKLQAVDNFKKEFQDIVSNPILLRAAAALENERQSQLGVSADWNDFFRKIGNEVRSAIPRQHQPAASAAPQAVAPTADNTSPTSDREARKASIVNLPTAAARASAPAEDKPESREEILNQMRKARHLPTG